MPEFAYRKSSFSDEKAECVEVATNIPATVAIRDSKNPGEGFLQLRPSTWTFFQTALLEGQL
ncbi:DUF397 domain-containing protein [Streptomyces sp. DG2A-72]|uniref:DUF397 domain-containing protein n=1 Tax=Streptomyces sp. DG2A-72 TaxID=3051386 RepID=UPI00265BBB42|nr:DUF397 domain-containing protein [Streptomyces sp. DG2A-72]MDO0932941.1 DUF397 domain-containing protein [Streptomyces sp. DG2A-72]